MMQLKRVFVSLLVAIMMLSMAVVAVSAADTASATFDVAVEPVGVTADIEGNIPVTPGDTVEINVVINNNPGVCVTSFDVVYNAEALEYDATGVVNGDVYEIYAVTPAAEKVSVYTDMMATEDVTSVGTIITLTFKVKDSFTGENTKITVNNVLAVNANMDPVGTTGSNTHVYDFDNAEIVEPTCEEAGYTYASCTIHENCGKKYDEVAALGHDTVAVEAVAATCSAAGNTAGEKCNRCDYNTSEVVPATGVHNEVKIDAITETCTSIGLTEGVKCKDCGLIIKAQEVVDAKGHNETTIDAVTATCTTAGYTEGKKCADCGVVTVVPEIVQPTAHNETTIAAVAATCKTAGSTEGKKCADCGMVTVAPEAVNPTAHTEETIAAVAASCTTAGSTEGKKCTVCGVVTVAPTVVQPTGHTLQDIPAVEPTVSEPGATAGKECTVCNEIVDATGEIPAKSLAWLWTLIICVVVFCGAGAAVYFLVIRKKISN